VVILYPAPRRDAMSNGLRESRHVRACMTSIVVSLGEGKKQKPLYKFKYE